MADPTPPQQPSAIVKTAVDRVMVSIAAKGPDIEKVLPAGMKLDRFITQVRLALNKNEDLANCDVKSLLLAVMTSAELGLDPSGRLGSAYLIPFKGQVTFVPGYRGLIDLAVRSGEVKAIKSNIVYWGDEFDYEEGMKPSLWHKPARPLTQEEAKTWKKRTEADIRAAYAVATLSSGEKQFLVMERWELDAIKARSPGAKSSRSPWSHPDDVIEMHRKAPVRKICKNLPLSPERARLLGLALAADDDEEIAVNNAPDPTRTPEGATTEVRRTVSDRVKDKLGVEDAEIVTDAKCGMMGPNGKPCVVQKGHEQQGVAHEDAAGGLW